MRMFADLSGLSERGLYTTLQGCHKSSQLDNSAPNFFRPGATESPQKSILLLRYPLGVL